MANFTPRELCEEKERRNSIVRSKRLSGFVREAWHVVIPGVPLEWNWHLDEICRHLELTVMPESRDDLDLVINIAPRHGKSNLVSVFFPAWVWTWRPSHQFLTSSYEQGLATRDAVSARRLIESTWYQERWPVTLAGDENRKTRYQNSEGGHRVTISTGSGGIGEGGDTIIADDPNPVKRGGLSSVDLEAAASWWNVVVSERRNDKRTASRIVIQQRLHENDLTGHLLRQGGWKHVCLPTRYEPDHPFAYPDDPRTKPGELLWPVRNGPDVVDEQERVMGSWAFSGQHQQRPSPGDGGILARSWWVHSKRESWPRMDSIAVAFDLAFKDGELNDYTAMAAVGKVGARFYALEVRQRRIPFNEQLAWVREVAARYPGVPVLIEDAANAAALMDTLRGEVPGLIPVKARTSKVARAQSWSPTLEAGQIHVPEGEHWVDPFLDQCAAFPNSSHDDMADAFGHAIARLLQTFEFYVA